MPTATRKTTTAKTTTKAKTAAAPTDVSENSNDNVFAAAEDFTSAAREQLETLMTSFNGNVEGMREQAEELTGEMRARFEKTQKHIADMNTDMMDAARTEMSEAVQFANDLAQAKTFADALDVQRNYWTNLFETRMERAREMSEASVELARESAMPATGSFANFFDNAKAFENVFPFAPKA